MRPPAELKPNHDRPLEGRVVVVTAGAWALGRELSLALARAGARVVVGDHDPGTCRETVRLAQEAGGSARFVPTNPYVAAQHERLVAITLEEHGRLDALVCNADLGHGAPARIEGFDAWQWRHQVGGIVGHPYLATRAALPAMRSAGRGTLVLTGRLLEKSSQRYLGAHSAQAGMEALVQGIDRVEGPAGIRCFGLRPGDLTSFRLAPAASSPEAARVPTPTDVARVCVELVAGRLRFKPGTIVETA